MNANRYYGIYIQRDGDTNDRENEDRLHIYTSYDDAIKVIKEFKNSRFKYFTSEEEATYFAIHGSTSGPGNPSVVTESTPFRSLKREEVQNFRTQVESDNLLSVEKMVWENPRYIVGIGDTPTIMREGPRYNALHIAAIYDSYKTADYILKTISDKSFIQLLYGANGDHSYVVRPEVLLDRYLNTPDKALNETPLHYAAKHGSLNIVRILVQYPQLQLNLKNKHDQTPKDIVCKRFRVRSPNKSSDVADVAWYTNEINKLLNETFYVPVWRSNEDVIQPIIGKPFSPKSPPVYPLATSPLSPKMEIKAVAGPMSYDEASTFHKTWKSPIQSNTPHVSKGVLLRSPLCCDKSLEKVGRTLAKRYHVSWKEYWPFLNDFADLASEAGLELLEKHLQNVIVTTTLEAEKNSFIMNTPMSDLCNAFSKFSIVSPKFRSYSSGYECGEPPSITSPYLCMDNLCSAFAKDLISEFEFNFYRNALAENNLPVLIKKIRNLSGTINSCVIDRAFSNFSFEKIHARVAFWIRSNLSTTNIQMLRYVGSIFQLVHNLDGCDLTYCITVSPASSKVELTNIVRNLKCVNTHVIKLLGTEEIGEMGPQWSKEWSSMERCSCFSKSVNNHNAQGKGDLTKRKLFCARDESPPEEKIRSDAPLTETHVQVTDIKTNCDNDTKCPYRIPGAEVCNSDSEDEFVTPPSSICNSDDEMESPDEGPELFIYDNRGTSMDNAVLDAIADVKIDPNRYPSIYRWRHHILMHNNLKRFSWPSPNITHLRSKKLRT